MRKLFKWTRFSLKTMLALFLLASIVCAFHLRRMRVADCIRQLENKYGSVVWEREKPSWLDQQLGYYRFDSVKQLDLGVNYDSPYFSSYAYMHDPEPVQKERLTDLKLVTPILNAHKVPWLKFKYTNVEDISSLNGCKHLTNLSLPNSVKDLTPVKTMTSLLSLRIGGRLDESSLLNDLQNLYYLTIENSGLKEIKCIQNMPNLWMLELNSTNVSDIGPLAQKKELYRLRLSNSPVSDLSPLKGISIEVLELDQLKLQSLQPLSRAKEIQLIMIDDCVKIDGSPLDLTDLLHVKGLKKIRVDGSFSRDQMQPFVDASIKVIIEGKPDIVD